MKFRKKPVVIEAHRWWKNGDHPDDKIITFRNDTGELMESEGKVVRRFRNPEIPGGTKCSKCGMHMHEHGWMEDGHNVCPGDWIITGIKNELYPCKPDIFDATYERVDD